MIELDPRLKTPLYEQLYAALADEIRRGGRAPGRGLWVRLPPAEPTAGAIPLESEPGARTTVHLLLPLPDPAESPEPAHPPESGA